MFLSLLMAVQAALTRAIRSVASAIFRSEAPCERRMSGWHDFAFSR